MGVVNPKAGLTPGAAAMSATGAFLDPTGLPVFQSGQNSGISSYEVSLLNHPTSTYTAVGFDAVDNVVFINDATAGQLKIATTTDGWKTLTVSTNKGLPTAPNAVLFSGVSHIVRHQGKLYLLALDSVTNICGVYQATPVLGNTAYTWALVFQFENCRATGTFTVIGTAVTVVAQTTGSVQVGQGFVGGIVPVGATITAVSGGNCTLSAGFGTDATTKSFTAGPTYLYPDLSSDGTNLYLGEYGDPGNGPTVYRSPDGVTWTTIYDEKTGTGLPVGSTGHQRHCHAIAGDPYVPGSVWMTLGDANAAREIMHSTDFGTTWAVFESNAAWQGVQISFTPNFVYIAGDSVRGHAIVIDKVKGLAFWGCNGQVRNMGVPAAAALADQWFFNGWLGAVDPVSGAFYFALQSDGAGGNISGFFVVPRMGDAPVCIEKLSIIANPVDIFQGYVWYGKERRALPTITAQ